MVLLSLLLWFSQGFIQGINSAEFLFGLFTGKNVLPHPFSLLAELFPCDYMAEVLGFLHGIDCKLKSCSRNWVWRLGGCWNLLTELPLERSGRQCFVGCRSTEADWDTLGLIGLSNPVVLHWQNWLSLFEKTNQRCVGISWLRSIDCLRLDCVRMRPDRVRCNGPRWSNRLWPERNRSSFRLVQPWKS
jgi:hypothetical protein